MSPRPLLLLVACDDGPRRRADWTPVACDLPPLHPFNRSGSAYLHGCGPVPPCRSLGYTGVISRRQMYSEALSYLHELEGGHSGEVQQVAAATSPGVGALLHKVGGDVSWGGGRR
jgi:hypothetical protein